MFTGKQEIQGTVVQTYENGKCVEQHFVPDIMEDIITTNESGEEVEIEDGKDYMPFHTQMEQP